MTDNNDDRRCHPRLPVMIPVEYKNLSDFFVDYALDISNGGMFIATERKIAPGTDVEICFTLHETGANFTAKGKVVRHGSAPQFQLEENTPLVGIGIQFDPLTSDSLEVIEQLWEKKIKE